MKASDVDRLAMKVYGRVVSHAPDPVTREHWMGLESSVRTFYRKVVRACIGALREEPGNPGDRL